MNNRNRYSNKSFVFALVSVCSAILVLVVQWLLYNQFISHSLYDTLTMIALIIFLASTVIGVRFTIKSFKEPLTVKKGIGLAVHLIFTIFIFFMIVANILDIYKALN